MRLIANMWDSVTDMLGTTLLAFKSDSSAHQMLLATGSQLMFQVATVFDRNYDHFRLERLELAQWANQHQDSDNHPKLELAKIALNSFQQLLGLQARSDASDEQIMQAFHQAQGAYTAWRVVVS